ncbi:hypothetical protein ACFVZH_35965 [Streptomyces sp. NPDC059534]|uniref:hypothetical protein n=1 Tax=Streptomyces sp. NPDC059534 TaxID=3346859 RepID=UPI003695482E
MSIDAELHIRWGAGEQPLEERLAEALALNPDPVNPAWREGLAPDGSRYGVRVSTDAGDIVGPTVYSPGISTGQETPRYSVMLHVSPNRVGDDVEDGFASMRSYCRQIIETLKHRWKIIEYAFAVESDGLVNYGLTASASQLSGEYADLHVWIGSQTPFDLESFITSVEFSSVDAPAAAVGKILGSSDPGEIVESLTERVSELDHQRMLVISGVRSEEANSVMESLVSEVSTQFPGIDLAIWIDGVLHRYEVELLPLSATRQ